MRFPWPVVGVVILAVAGACAPNAPPTVPTGKDAAGDPVPPRFGLNEAQQRALATVNAAARATTAEATDAGGHPSTQEVPPDDPFRALEQTSTVTDHWIDTQTRITAEALQPFRRPEAEARLAELLSIGAIGDIAQRGARIFFTLRSGEREQAALYVHDGELQKQPLVDPQRIGPRAAIDYHYPSPSGRFVAYGVSDNGDERAQLRVVNVETGETLTDTIDHAKWSSLSWLHDDSGFYYTRYPRPGEPHYDAEQEDSYFPAVYFHRLSTDPAKDPLVFRGETPTDFPTPSVGSDDRFLVINNYRGWTASDVWLLSRGDPKAPVKAPDAEHPLRAVVSGLDKLSSGRVHNGQLFLLTNHEAPLNRIVAVDPSRASDPSQWRTVIAESDARIESWTLFADHLAVHRIRDVASELTLHRLDGSPVGNVPLPAAGSIDGLSAGVSDGGASFLFSSYFYPPCVFHVDPAAPEKPEPRYQVPHSVDTAAFSLSRATTRSRDGTPINIFYAHRVGLALSGDHPVLLTGYGGFDISLLPTFTRTALHWLELGGVYAVANLRGGGEYGEAWHRAGMGDQKHHVFEDFEAAVRFFGESGISRPDRIAIRGGSNGGLLMGALITRAPHTFGAAIASVGLYDMLRYTLFPPAQLWISEYGDPTDATVANYLRSYSPYHNVQQGTPYPHVLVETADHDTRVHWSHSTKFSARLQTATSSGRPVLFHMERELGHGRGTGLSDLIEQHARQEAFLRAALGMRPPPAVDAGR